MHSPKTFRSAGAPKLLPSTIQTPKMGINLRKQRTACHQMAVGNEINKTKAQRSSISAVGLRSNISAHHHSHKELHRIELSPVETNLHTLSLDHAYPLIDCLESEEARISDLFADMDGAIAHILDGLCHSKTAQSLAQDAMEEGWDIVLDNLSPENAGGPDFQIHVSEETQEQNIVLNDYGLGSEAVSRAPYMQHKIAVALIRALRDVWQEKRYGACDDIYAPQSFLTWERIRNADLDVMVVLVAWELRQAENTAEQGGLWRHIMTCENGDLAMRFSGSLEQQSAEENVHEENVHTALKASFTQWFRNPERVNDCDHETLSLLDHMLMDDDNEGSIRFGSERLTAIAAERLSCQPDKTGYLQGMGHEILSNPLYAGMDDDINQSHLMHILNDMHAVYAGGVAFRDAALAAKIFPDETACGA